MKRKPKLVEDVHRSFDRWELFMICVAVVGVMMLGFAFYQSYLLLREIMNAPVGEAHLIEKPVWPKKETP
tara:strand:+ start:728 stop:937 length:210 start_codon:yes stop_codon:yes gene_type:complete